CGRWWWNDGNFNGTCIHGRDVARYVSSMRAIPVHETGAAPGGAAPVFEMSKKIPVCTINNR
ncbi:MAG: hypothetical protein K6C07_03310, partial [Bacteroidales bacterium]|nr:hypothetical protein [Bacteroidales bacterium]